MRKTCLKHQLKQFLVETQVANPVHGDEFHFTIREAGDEPAAEFFEGSLVIGQVVVLEIDDPIALLIAQFDFFEHIFQ